MNERRAILFDAAGTLIELRESVGTSYARIAHEFGVTLPPERLDDAFRRVFKSSAPMAFPGARPADVPSLEREWWRRCVRSTFRAADGSARFDDFEAFFDRLFDAMGASAWRPVDGAAELLRALRARGWAIAIVSNFDSRLRAILDELELTELVDEIVLSSDVGAAKPDPAVFERALAMLDVAPEHALVVGDDPDLDLEGARNAGLRAIDVASLATIGRLLDRTEA